MTGCFRKHSYRHKATYIASLLKFYDNILRYVATCMHGWSDFSVKADHNYRRTKLFKVTICIDHTHLSAYNYLIRGISYVRKCTVTY